MDSALLASQVRGWGKLNEIAIVLKLMLLKLWGWQISFSSAHVVAITTMLQFLGISLQAVKKIFRNADSKLFSLVWNKDSSMYERRINLFQVPFVEVKKCSKCIHFYAIIKGSCIQILSLSYWWREERKV